MTFKVKLVLEFVGRDNIYIATYDDSIPFCNIDECPKQCSANLLKNITNITINPYENDFLTLELVDTYYEKDSDTAYIIYVCRIGEKLTLNSGYEWTEFIKIRPEIDKLRGLI